MPAKVLPRSSIVTKALAIRYLWIDNLCILQGSLGDWKKRGGVYARCLQSPGLHHCCVVCRGQYREFARSERFALPRFVSSKG
jgi:hypothetical protein